MSSWLSRAVRWLKQARQAGTTWYLLALLCLLPVWFNPTINLRSQVADTLFVIDVSESMNVQDVSHPRPNTSRLHLAKAAVTAGLAALPCGSRVSIGLFAGEDVVVLFEPLEVCGHYASIEKVISQINTNMRWIGDSWIIRGLMSSIKAAQQRGLNLVLVTDADEMPHSTTARIADLLPYQGKVNAILCGVGDETPLPVPKVDAQGNLISYWTPEQAVMEGNYPNLLGYVKYLDEGEQIPDGALDEVSEHLSAYNPTLLQNIALMLKVQHIKLTHPKEGIQYLNNFYQQTVEKAPKEIRWVFALAALGAVFVGWFFKKKPKVFNDVL